MGRKDMRMDKQGAPEDTIENTALYKRAKPRSVRETMSEFIKTGNPLAWWLMASMEPRFEFAPQHTYQCADASAFLQPPLSYGLREYRQRDLHLDTGETVTAWYKPAKEGFPTIAYCHGNAGSLDARVHILKELADRGFGVMIAAYPGFKGHKKRPKVQPSEEGCCATGHAMVRELVNRWMLPMDKIVLFGESLGGAVALRTAYNIEKGMEGRGYEPSRLPAVICFNTFTSLVKRAREQFPMLPAGFLMQNRFESDRIIGDIQSPVLLMHGKDDEYTPCRHSAALQRASGGRAKLALLEGVTHSATFPGTERSDPRQVRRLIDHAQQFMHEQGLCPAPERMPEGADNAAAYIGGTQAKGIRRG